MTTSTATDTPIAAWASWLDRETDDDEEGTMGETTTIAERAAAGAALLDERFPDWWRQIDLDRLDMATEDRCVLGQQFGLWKHGIDALRLPRNYRAPGAEAIPYGFDLSREMPRSDYPTLTAAWRLMVRARRIVARATRNAEQRGAADAGEG